MSDASGSETQNIAVVRRGYEAFGKGDVETLKTLFATNAHWRALKAGVLPGNCEGLQAILGFFGQIAHETQGTIRVEPLTMAASGHNVFVLQRVAGARKGKKIDANSVLIFTLANHIVTEVAEFQSNYPEVAQFWS